MIRFCSLSSGSSGNCIFIGTENTKILIDAGLSGAKTENALEQFGESCGGISAVLLTHEHRDHIFGAGIISRRYDIPIYATKGTWDSMDIGKICDSNRKIFNPDEGSFKIGEIEILPFRTPHDAAEPVAYSFFTHGHKLSVATDIGHVTDRLINCITGSELVLLESNHDTDRLRYGTYPKSLKDRISGENGHLSNDEAAGIVVEMAKRGTKTFFLGHLSHENNTPKLAFDTSCRCLKNNGFENGKDVFMYIAKRDMPTKVVTIGE